MCCNKLIYTVEQRIDFAIDKVGTNYLYQVSNETDYKMNGGIALTHDWHSGFKTNLHNVISQLVLLLKEISN